jgi:hypothetical protein
MFWKLLEDFIVIIGKMFFDFDILFLFNTFLLFYGCIPIVASLKGKSRKIFFLDLYIRHRVMQRWSIFSYLYDRCGSCIDILLLFILQIMMLLQEELLYSLGLYEVAHNHLRHSSHDFSPLFNVSWNTFAISHIRLETIPQWGSFHRAFHYKEGLLSPLSLVIEILVKF